MSNNTITPFLLLRLPLLVLKEIFMLSTTYELFAYSILSKRSKRIVKLACSHRKFQLNFDPSPHDNCNYLSFLDMYACGSQHSRLSVYTYCDDAQLPDAILKMDGNTVPASVKFEKVGNQNPFFDDSISTYWDDQNYGLRWMCHHLADTFKIGSLDLNYSGNDKSFLIKTAALLKSFQPINRLYDRGWNIYTFEQVMSFMPAEFLFIQYPKMKYSQLITLFKMWKEGRAAEEINLYKCPKHMSIRPLARLVEGRPEVNVEGGYRSFEVMRDDGRRGLVYAYIGDSIIFRVIRS